MENPKSFSVGQGRRAARKFTKQTLAQALVDCGGVKSAVARALGCERARVDRWLEKWPDLRKVYDEQTEILVDAAESKLKEAVVRGEPWAVKLTLETKGKHRGYTRSSEISQAGQAPIQSRPMTLDDFKQQFNIEVEKI